MKSNRPSSFSGSRVRAQNSRTLGSIASMLFGVNTRDMRPRCASCAGGSSIRIIPDGTSIPDMMISSVEPFPERKVSQSTNPRSTSPYRVSAQKSYLSLRYSGASSRMRFQTGCGSLSTSLLKGS